MNIWEKHEKYHACLTEQGGRGILVTMPSKKKTKNIPAQKSPVLSKIQYRAEMTPNVPVYYCNYVQVGHSEHEFFLNVFQAPPLLRPEHFELSQKGLHIPLEPMAQIIMPAAIGSRLIDALVIQKEKFEGNFGPVDKRKKERG